MQERLARARDTLLFVQARVEELAAELLDCASLSPDIRLLFHKPITIIERQIVLLHERITELLAEPPNASRGRAAHCRTDLRRGPDGPALIRFSTLRVICCAAALTRLPRDRGPYSSSPQLHWIDPVANTIAPLGAV